VPIQRSVVYTPKTNIVPRLAETFSQDLVPTKKAPVDQYTNAHLSRTNSLVAERLAGVPDPPDPAA
jgi:hypothetical protein